MRTIEEKEKTIPVLWPLPILTYNRQETYNTKWRDWGITIYFSSSSSHLYSTGQKLLRKNLFGYGLVILPRSTIKM